LSDDYWHIGETAIRFRSTTSFSRNSSNRPAMRNPSVQLSGFHQTNWLKLYGGESRSANPGVEW
jgi:hypothetical protein